jgi:hypothetical protein
MGIVNLIAIKRQLVSYVVQLDWQMRKQMGRDFFMAAGDKFATVPDWTSEVLPSGGVDEAPRFFAISIGSLESSRLERL